MNTHRLQQLLRQYFDGTITRRDCEELLAYLDERDSSIVEDVIDKALEADESQSALFATDRRALVYNQLKAEIKQREAAIGRNTQHRKLRMVPWMKVAAVLVATLSIGFWFYDSEKPVKDRLLTAASRDSILLPDYNEAVLTLADGRTIELNDSVNGILASESGVEIKRTEDGSVLYEVKQVEVVGTALHYNTFSAPKGSTYQIILPDGTKVWLNTASSIRYPVAFSGNERQVFLVGEAYFEVAHDAAKPFSVNANGGTIQVLGTHFNVAAYADKQQMTTTLVEGMVNVSKNGKSVTLRPNQRAVLDTQTGQIHREAADTQSAIAWKNGYFRFDNESIEEIMDKISRWYDIAEVDYQGIVDDRFTGTFRRSKNVAQLFNNLEKLAPIRFKIVEGRVAIMK